MEHIIVSRVILFAVFVFHVFVGYAGPAVLSKHIKSWLYDALFAVEISAITGYIVYDNIVCPTPHDGWFLAIVGYFFVFAVIILTWIAFSPLTINPKKVYELTNIKYKIRSVNEKDFEILNGVIGTISEGKRKFQVILLDDEAYDDFKKGQQIYVILDSIHRDGDILVTRVKENTERKGFWAE